MWHTVALLHDGVEGVVVTPGVVRFYSGEDVESVKLVQLVNKTIAMPKGAGQEGALPQDGLLGESVTATA